MVEQISLLRAGGLAACVMAATRLEAAGAGFAFALDVAISALPVQRPRKTGARFSTNAPKFPAPVEALRAGLSELGYIEGSTIRIEYRWAEGNPGRLPALAKDLIDTGVDLIVASGDAPIRAARDATRTIPIVMATSGDAVGAGFVVSLAKPGGNVTGMTAINPELGAKRLQLISEILPAVTRIGVLWNPLDAVHALDLRVTQAAAKMLNISLKPVEIRGVEDVSRAFLSFTASNVEAFVAFNDTTMISGRGLILETAAARSLPGMYEASEWADLGGFVAYGVTHSDLFRQSAKHVDQLLRGAKPSDLPVQQPINFRLTINLVAARALGIKVPTAILYRADRVIG